MQHSHFSAIINRDVAIDESTKLCKMQLHLSEREKCIRIISMATLEYQLTIVTNHVRNSRCNLYARFFDDSLNKFLQITKRCGLQNEDSVLQTTLKLTEAVCYCWHFT